jgi:hypothetical protein
MTSWDVASISSGSGGRRVSILLQEEGRDDLSVRTVSYIDGENSPGNPDSLDQSYQQSFAQSHVQSYEQSEVETRVPTPKNTGLILPISGPGLLAEPETTKATPVSFCPRCGLKIDAADTKMIPKQKVWCLFLVLFLCCCWCVSWIPFLFKSCTKPVEICPYCYRRTDRPPVGSDNNHHFTAAYIENENA